jgi:large subunit ribosomal protein L23
MAIFSTNKNKTKNKTSEESEVAIKETKKVSKKVSALKTGTSVATAKFVEATTPASVGEKGGKLAPAIVNTSGISAQPLFTIVPHVTEKAHFHAEKLNSYTFKVNGNSNKKSIAKAIQTKYKVTPTKVRIVNTAPRNVSYRGRPVTKSGFKKAYVTLKKGDKIEIA